LAIFLKFIGSRFVSLMTVFCFNLKALDPFRRTQASLSLEATSGVHAEQRFVALRRTQVQNPPITR
jgi:hypothetical protein